MRLFGLTGGVGMGKSTAVAVFRDLGVPVADTDQIARDIVAPGTEGATAIRQAFGAGCFLPSGELDRKALASIVFESPERRAVLESILHPPIRARWKSLAAGWAEDPVIAHGVVDIPLLYETGAEDEFDAVLCVACGEATQRARLKARGWNERDIERRVQAQWPVRMKMDRADHVIWTEGPRTLYRPQIERIMGVY